MNYELVTVFTRGSYTDHELVLIRQDVNWLLVALIVTVQFNLLVVGDDTLEDLHLLQ